MATRVPLTVDQGATFTYSTELATSNAMVAVSSLRKSYTSANSVDFTTTVANGNLTLALSASQTLSLESGRYVYDVLVTNTVQNTISRVIEGVVTVRPGATKITYL